MFALVGLSGSVLVFHDDMLQWQHPQLAGHEPRADGAVLARILDQWSPEGLGSVHLPEPDGVPTWQGYFGDGRRGYFDPSKVDASTSTYTLHFNDEQTVAVNGVEELHFSDQSVTLPKLS